MSGMRPRTLGVTGWWIWNDQGLYVKAARAWAAGNLDPLQHWYFPGYPLLGAAFSLLTPIQPFYLPDLLCLLAFGWLFTLLAARLAPDLRWSRAIGAVTFFVTVGLSPWEMKVFVEPWSTTPTAPLALGSLILAMRFWDRPSASRAALLGLVAAAAILFRPTDAAVLLAVCGASAGITLLLHRLRWRDAAAATAAGIAGAAAPVVLLAGLHLSIFGWHWGSYIEQSRLAGFEWRLLPLRWVMIFVSPQPLFADNYGLAQEFPWIAPGVAGMAACLIASRGSAWFRHALVTAAIGAHCAAYLAYRDLHPQGLLHFSNYHYFKWVLPVFGLYTVYLFALIWTAPRRRLAWGAGAVAVIALFGWRPQWVEHAPGYTANDARIEGPQTLVLPHGLHCVRDGVRLAATGDYWAIYSGQSTMQTSDRTYSANNDLKSFPVPGGLLFTVLRPTPPGESVVTFNPEVTLNQSMAPEIGRQTLVFGWPGWGKHIRERLDAWWRGEPGKPAHHSPPPG